MVHQSYSQQDPQYTQYMYNTMLVNPAYAGARDALSASILHRSQWVGIDGAPRTQTLSVHSPLGNPALALGLTVSNDEVGPARENYIDANYSYTLYLGLTKRLSFGVRAGLQILNTDWSKGIYKVNPDQAFAQNINLTSPTVGSGVYLHAENWYVGLSVPNFITSERYDDEAEVVSKERINYYLIAGYVWNISTELKFKPAVLVKSISGAPISLDVSANFQISEVVTLGLAYRWDESLSALAGFQISKSWMIGYSYDYNTTELNKYNSGSHEIFLRFELDKTRIRSPRFF